MSDTTDIKFPDQWYNKNPRLFQMEVRSMRRQFPKAVYGHFKNNGNMYWLLPVKIFQTEGITKLWTFLLVYDKDHPRNSHNGGSIKVIPVVPSLDELREIAKQNGRPGVPHVTVNANHFMKRWLCLRLSPNPETDENYVFGAIWYAARAADWAVWFEVGMRDSRVWNKWCNEDYFRYLRVPEGDIQ